MGWSFRVLQPSRFGSGRCRVQTDLRWGNSIIKWYMHCTVMKTVNLLIMKMNKSSQASAWDAYWKGAPQTGCAAVMGVLHLERGDPPVILGHTQCSHTSVASPPPPFFLFRLGEEVQVYWILTYNYKVSFKTGRAWYSDRNRISSPLF